MFYPVCRVICIYYSTGWPTCQVFCGIPGETGGEAVSCDGAYLTQSNEPAAGQDVFHLHLHVYPCWEGGEVQAISRFVRSVTDPEHVTGEMKTERMQRIKRGLVGDYL